MAESSLIDSYGVYIDGNWVEPANERYDVINPATEQVITSAPDAGVTQVEQAITAARAAFNSWATADPAERSRCLQQLSDALLARGDEIYALAQAEWGCTANERLMHVGGPAFMVGRAAELALEPVEAPMDAWGAAGTTLLRYEPSVCWR
jgi:aldehyde dehydrogenase (NAD+)